MNRIRQELITIAATETDLSKIQSGLDAIKTGKSQEHVSGYLSEKGACKFSGNCSRSKLWSMRQEGLKSYKLNGRRLYDPEDIKSFIRKEGNNE